MHRPLRFAAALALPLAAVLAAPAVASHGNFAARVDGSFTDAAGEGSFDGTLTLARFERRGDALVAVGTLDGTFTDATGKQLGELADREVALTLPLAALRASCKQATMTLRPTDAEAAGLRAHLRPVEVEIAASAAPGHRLDAPLCELAGALEGEVDAGVVAERLDRVLAALE
jgi:hypothetical protein